MEVEHRRGQVGYRRSCSDLEASLADLIQMAGLVHHTLKEDQKNQKVSEVSSVCGISACQ